MVEFARQIENQAPFISGQQKILFINNFDSFVYNLVNYICTCSESKVKVVENSITLSKAKKYKPDKIFISPGPGHPKYETGNVISIIKSLGPSIPIMGVCLGHQAICEAFGEETKVEYVGRAKVGPKHGKLSKTFHDGELIFEDIPNPCKVVRYHSLAAKADLLSKDLKIIAMADDGTIMGVKHRDYDIFGVQFHPESIMMKPYGIKIISNFLRIGL
ncbi:MAG: aminodeoxychorismate/anthranilate synthase component II [Candidatus Lokiarchaeota archaeon]|nr:aminodeoxychorismate/anthranilate synthase component II [Candidatus Lokiarchaeota archaeon]